MSLSTRVLKVDPGDVDAVAIGKAAAVIRAGGVVAFPTETVYGLGADATNPAAVARIFQAKGRPPNNPLIVHGHEVDDVRQAVAGWPELASKLAEVFWPGPLTLVLPRSHTIPDIVTAGLDSVGIRVPDCAVALALLRRVRRLVAAPSANRSTGVSPTTAAHVLKDLDGRIDLILDAGSTPVGIESTVLDLTSSSPRILRPGAITAGQIGHALGIEVATGRHSSETTETAHASPGQMEVHYAPRALVCLMDPEDVLRELGTTTERIGLIVAGRSLPFLSGLYTERVDWSDPEQAARELYATLHRWDEAAFDRIDVVLPALENDAWRAVRDRLWRASRRWARTGQGGSV